MVDPCFQVVEYRGKGTDLQYGYRVFPIRLVRECRSGGISDDFVGNILQIAL